MKPKENKIPNIKLNKKVQRKYAIEAGFYDGRFRTKIQILKKFKKPKYKNRLL